LEDRRSKDDKVPRGVWKTLEANADKTRIAKTKGGRTKRGEGRKERRKKTKKEKEIEEKKDNVDK